MDLANSRLSPLMIMGGARAMTVALIGVSFILIDKRNYVWFAGAAVLFAMTAFILIGWFDRMRKTYLCKVPTLNANGTQAHTFWGKPKYELIVIGDETNMKPDAAAVYAKTKAISLCGFVSGFGRNKLNDPAAIWSMETLAKISNRMTMALMSILLCAVMALYLAASSIEVQQRPVGSALSTP